MEPGERKRGWGQIGGNCKKLELNLRLLCYWAIWIAENQTWHIVLLDTWRSESAYQTLDLMVGGMILVGYMDSRKSNVGTCASGHVEQWISMSDCRSDGCRFNPGRVRFALSVLLFAFWARLGAPAGRWKLLTLSP